MWWKVTVTVVDVRLAVFNIFIFVAIIIIHCLCTILLLLHVHLPSAIHAHVLPLLLTLPRPPRAADHRGTEAPARDEAGDALVRDGEEEGARVAVRGDEVEAARLGREEAARARGVEACELLAKGQCGFQSRIGWVGMEDVRTRTSV